jgi:hypothetical protein
MLTKFPYNPAPVLQLSRELPIMSVLGRYPRRTLALVAGFLFLGACGAGADADVYAIPLTEAKAKVRSTQASYIAGSQTRSMRSAGVEAGGLRVTMPNAGTFSSSCFLRFEAVDEQSTRITPDCGDTGAATSDAAARFVELEIAALVRQTLTGEPVDAETLGKQMAKVAFKNMPKMQQEGFAANEEWVQQQQEKAIQRAKDAEDGWGE